MHLYPNWKEIVRKAWSIRLIACAFVFTLLEVGLPFFSDDIPSKLFGLLSALFAAGAFVSRLVAQKDV